MIGNASADDSRGEDVHGNRGVFDKQTRRKPLAFAADAAAVLFAPMRPLLAALVPYEDPEIRTEVTAMHAVMSEPSRWAIVFLLGALIGCFLFVGEMSEDSGLLPLGRAAFVASIFVGLSITGLLIAYAFLGAPLGLARRRAKPISGN